MNIIGPGLLDAAGKAALTADLVSLVSDPDVSVSVTIKTPTGGTFDPASGIAAPVTVDDTVTCYASPLTSREVDDSGLYQEGDHRLLIDVTLLNTAPTGATEVTIDGALWRAISVDRDSLLAVYHIVIRKSS